MVAISSLWLPIVLSAVVVFLLSWIFHTVLPFHRSDYKPVPSEDQVMEALGKFNLPPGDYMMPCPKNMQAMKDPAFIEKHKKGPVLIMTVMKPGVMNMGPALLKWFVYLLLVGVLCAYVSGRALHGAAPYLSVFRFAGVTAFIGYTIALFQDSIWYQRSWGTTIRNTVDGLIYALMTGGVFGWLWPR